MFGLLSRGYLRSGVLGDSTNQLLPLEVLLEKDKTLMILVREVGIWWMVS
jgi:hypothetical protein